MARLLVINCTILAVAFLLGIFSATNLTHAENKLAERKKWEVDAETAKTIAQEAGEEEEVHHRQKKFRVRFRRVFGKRRREKNREADVRRAACQASCWSAWSTPGPCSVSCGTGGRRERTRTQVRYDCSCPGETILDEECTEPCENGGTPRLDDCTCPPEYTGTCCESFVPCPELLPPKSGSIAPCNNTYRSVCNQSCNSGYVVNAGTPSRECLFGGFWSGRPIKCKACPKDTYQESTYFCQRCPDNAGTASTASLLTDCICSTGFESEGPGQNCIDIDECAGDHPCEQECINSQGSYRCKCGSGYSLVGLPDQNPTDCTRQLSTCPVEDLIPPLNGSLACGIANVYEEYCSPRCNPGYEILDQFDEYITCTLATSWKWSHTVTGDGLPICAAILFETPIFEGSFVFFNASCSAMTEEQMGEAEDDFIQKLEDNGICHIQPGGNCEIKGVDVKCGEEYEAPPPDPDFPFPLVPKKHQASPQFDTLIVNYTLVLNIGFTQCTEVDCQKKYDKLVEVEQQRIRNEILLAIQPYTGRPGCSLCLTIGNGSMLVPRVTGGVRVPCPDGAQRKGYTCRRCQSGMYHDRQTGNCTLCPPGKYQPEAGQTECLDCPYLVSLGKSGTTKCPVPTEKTYDCGTNNPCLAITDPDFQQYYSHTNAGNFIQCSGYGGQCYVMPCPTGSIWKPGDNYCIPASSIRMTDIY